MKIRQRESFCIASILFAFSAGGCDQYESPPNTDDSAGLGDTPHLDSFGAQFSSGDGGVPMEAMGDGGFPLDAIDDGTSASSESTEELSRKQRIAGCPAGVCEQYRWVKGVPEVVMSPKSTHVCTLSRVSGSFGEYETWGGMAAVSVAIDRTPFVLWNNSAGSWGNQRYQERPNWTLAGFQASRNSLAAEAICVPKSRFRHDSGGAVWVSPRFQAGTYSGTATKNLWNGDAASMLTGLWAPAMDDSDGGDYSRVQVSDDPTRPSRLTFSRYWPWYDGRQVTGSAFAQSVFVGVPHSGHRRRDALFGTPGNLTREASLVARDGQSKARTLASAYTSMCYLTEIGGDFAGAREDVGLHLSLNTKQWILIAKAGPGHHTRVRARCVNFDQRTDTVPDLI